MAFDDGNLEHVRRGIRLHLSVPDRQRMPARLGHDPFLDRADDPRGRVRRRAGRRQREIHLFPIYAQGVQDRVRDGYARGGRGGDAFPGGQYGFAVGPYPDGRQIVGLVPYRQIRAASGADGAPVVQPEPFRRVERSQAEGVRRIQALRAGAAHEAIHAAFLQEIGRNAVVGAEAEAAQGAGRHQRQERIQIARDRAFPDQDVHAFGQLFFRFGQGRAFVVAADAGGEIGVEVRARELGRVAVHDGRLERLQDGQALRVAAHDARIVHHLGQAVDHAFGVERLQGRRVQVGAVRLQMAGGHAGRGHPLHAQGRLLAAGVHVANAGRPGYVGDFMGIGHDGRNAARRHRLAERQRRAETAFDVDMGVDEAGRDQQALAIDFLRTGITWGYAGDATLRDGDVAGLNRPREHVQDAPVLQDEVRRRGAPGDLDQALQLAMGQWRAHKRRSYPVITDLPYIPKGTQRKNAVSFRPRTQRTRRKRSA